MHTTNAAAGPESSTRLELRNGRVADVKAGRSLEPGVSIVVQGGTIVAMPGVPGHATGDDGPPDLVVDLGGRAVIPGLFNTHCHVALPMPGTLLGLRESTVPKQHGRAQVQGNLTECLERGITTIRDCLCENLRISRRLKAALADGALPGPRLLQAVLVGQAGGTFTAARNPAAKVFMPMVGLPVLSYDDEASGILAFPLSASEAAVRAAVDRAIDERGADHIKIYEQREKKLSYKPGATVMSLAQLEALVDQARRRGARTTIHHVTVETFRRAVRAGVDCLAHLPIDGPLTADDVRAFSEAGCTIEPTTTLAYFFSLALEGGCHQRRLSRLEALRTASHRRRIEDHWVPALRPIVHRAFERAVAGRRRGFGVMDLSAVYRYFSPVVSQGFDNLRRIVEAAGIASIACGNDGGPCPSTPAGIDLELEMLDLCLSADDRGAPGLDGADALRVATVNSARALGLDGQLGAIEPGKLADLVVLDGDPLADRAVLGSRAAAVFKEGALVVNRCGLELVSAQAPEA